MALDEEKPENIIVPGQGLRRVVPLSLVSAIGFSGKVQNGLLVDPNKGLAYYPMGSSVVVWPFREEGQKSFLTGHTYLIGSIGLSDSGRYLATGETDVVGTKVQVIIWDTASLTNVGSHLLHHASVAAIGISPNDRYVASAGGQDDPTILIWDINAKAPICACKKTHDRPFVATKLKFSPDFDHVFMVGGQDAVHVWKLDEATCKANVSIIPLGKIKRTISDMVVCNGGNKAATAHSDYLFCATRSGDIVKLCVDFLAEDSSKTASVVAAAIKKAQKKQGMNAGKFTGGVTALLMIKPDELLVGSGDGNVCLVVDQTTKPSSFKKPIHDGIPKKISEPTKPCLTEIRSKQFPGSVTSLAQINKRLVLIGCADGTIFQLDILTFDFVMLSTCHTGAIYDVAFPRGVDTVFGTCGVDGIRIWSDVDKVGGREVLHIPGPAHAQANCILFSKDGKTIFSGWSDGCVRSYTPQSGKLLFTIQGAHPAGVTAMALLNNAMMTGGKDGQVRTWKANFYNPSSLPKLLTTLKEHTGTIVCLRTSDDEMEAITAGADSSCIIWNISKLHDPIRRQILSATSPVLWARIHPSQCQILTLATDGQVSYWETVDGTEIRSIVLGKHSTVTSLDIAPKGDYFVTSTNDSFVKVWKYKQGSLNAMGKARSGPISKTCYSPMGRYILAVTLHGGILIWNNYSED